MANRFIPNGDSEFLQMATGFSSRIAELHERFGISGDEAVALGEAVERYREKYAVVRIPSQRSPMATNEKDIARREAEKLIKRLAMRLRASEAFDEQARVQFGMREREAKSRTCPQEPPRLKFEKALHEAHGASPMHELSFAALEWGKRRPEGARQLELFVDLVEPDGEIPSHPGSNHGGRPWYLRSFTKSPIVVAPPMTDRPMRVVYWGRWADSVGNVGPFSATVAGWIEGGSRLGLPGSEAMDFRRKPKMIEEELREMGDSTVRVTVLQARVRQLNPAEVVSVERQIEAA